MPRVRIKHPDPSGSNKLRLLAILSERLIYATRIIQTQDSFIVLTRTDEDADKIFTTSTTDLFVEQQFLPVLPPEIRAKRTVVLLNVDEHIYNKPEKEITDELLSVNSFLSEGINNIFKIPKSRIIKITLNSSTAAKKATEIGMLGFNMSIPHYNIKIEDFIPITTCMRCYAIEKHQTNQCTEDKSYKACSECAGRDHTWRECKATSKSCLNCGGEHRTLANQCPMRKKAKEEKRREKQTTTYSQITQNNPTQNIPKVNLIDRETNLKIHSCMTHAHYLNSVNPGTFNIELQKLYKANNLPTIIIPEDPPSKLILNLNQQAQTNTNSQKNTQTQPRHRQATQQQSNNTAPEPERENTQREEEIPALEQLKGTEIGLQIITKKSEGWPREILNIRTLKKGMENGLYKWRYTNTAYSEQEIYHYICNNEISLNNCWCIIDDSQFNKIRSGQINERTPPPSKSRLRHLSK